MATGQNVQPGRGNQVSNLPPTVNTRTYDAEMWESAGKIFDRFTDAARPNLLRRAQERGAAEGAAIAAGEREYKPPMFQFGDIEAARQAAVESAYDARTRQDVDARLDELRRDPALRHDPEAFQAAAQEAVSGFIQNAPSEFAVQVETYARGKARDSVSAIANARAARDEQEVVQALGVRQGQLSERLIAFAAQEGGADSPEYLEARAEYDAIQDTRQDNPAILYSETQRLFDDEKLDTDILVSNIHRLSINAYAAAGNGSPGFAAATRFLRDEVLEGEAFQDQTPEAQQRVFRDLSLQLNQHAASDQAQRRVVAEDERLERAERRERVGEIRLAILTGGVTEADIRQRDDIEDSEKAGLVAAVRAQVRRERAEARSIAALDAAGSRDIYRGFADQANAGLLSSDEIAGAREAGLITAGQAATLRDMNDRQLKPIVDRLLGPVRDRARGRRNSSREIAIAEEAAIRVARENPNADLDFVLAAGASIANSAFGSTGAGRPSSPQAANSARLQRTNAANQRIRAAREAGRPFSATEEARIRNEAMNDE